MFVFIMHKMIYYYFLRNLFFANIIFCQYHETKFVSFALNLRGFEFVINCFAKFVIIFNV